MEGRLELRPTNTGMGYVAAKAQMQGCPTRRFLPNQYPEAGSSSMMVLYLVDVLATEAFGFWRVRQEGTCYNLLVFDD